MDQLLLRLPQDDTTAHWCLASAPDEIGHGPLTAAAAVAVGRRVVVLAPSSVITLMVTRLPGRQRRLQALPYALEEQLAAEVETLHFAAAAAQGDEVPCAVVDRATLRGWLATLEAAGIKPDVLVPDVLALPREAATWTLLAEAAELRLRYGAYRGLACDKAALPHLLPLLRPQAGVDKPQRLHLYEVLSAPGAATDTGLRTLLQEWCAASVIEFQYTPLTSALPVLLPAALRGEGIDLLQGEFSRREQFRQLWRPWRASAALLVVLLLLQAGMGGVHYFNLVQEDARLAAQIEQMYRSAFPEAQRVVNAPVQMEQKLQELRRGTAAQEFHRLLQHAGPALHDAGVELRALHYSAGLLDIEVTAGDLQTLDRLKQNLDGGALRAEITGADSSGGRVAGRIALRGEQS